MFLISLMFQLFLNLKYNKVIRFHFHILRQMLLLLYGQCNWLMHAVALLKNVIYCYTCRLYEQRHRVMQCELKLKKMC